MVPPIPPRPPSKVVPPKITAARTSNSNYTEKRPSSFVIDLGKCIYCGACVEVCPCDAIRMDTGLLDVSADTRQGMIYDKDDLLAWKELPDGSVVDLSRRAELGTRSEVGEQVGL